MAKAATKTKGTNKNMNAQTATVAAAAVGGKLSLEQKIANTEALLAKYRAQQNAERQINNVQVGDEGVTFKFGRSEKARNEVGTVVGLSDTPQGRMVAIQTGEGIDVAIRKVRAADIVTNPAADARTAAAGEGSTDEGSDPLAAE